MKSPSWRPSSRKQGLRRLHRRPRIATEKVAAEAKRIAEEKAVVEASWKMGGGAIEGTAKAQAEEAEA